MECPKCQYDNRKEAKFCLECGEKLELLCPHCDKTLPPSAKFCDECGHKISQPANKPSVDISFQKKLDKIQKYLPKGLTKKILTQRDKIEGEHKHVTVMFCDLQGYTTLSERLGPEEAYAIMDEIYEILIHKVHDYEGTVNEMTGDGIIALFGAPIALEDAPQRAIRSSLAIHRAMAKFSDQLKQKKEISAPFKMRIGINTGPVVVGTIGNDLRVDFKAVGDTVNLASRIENLAQPGTTYVTEATYSLTEGFFLFEALGPKDIKGMKAPVLTYQVIGPSTKRTRFDVSADRGLAPFVGREREFELLLDNFERAKSGSGQAISIVAEAGVGKSRLLYEFRKAVSSEDAVFLEGRCMSFSRSVAFYPVLDILKANFDIRENDRDSDIREKIKKGIKIVNADETSTLPYLLELFSVRDSGFEKLSLSPEGKKDRIIEAVKLITLKGAEIRPIILAYEDLHWMDRGSEDFLKNVLQSIPGARVLMIFTYRPEYMLTWGGKSYYNQLTLNRLSNRESLKIVNYLFGTEAIEAALEELILEKTEGIPFFIEEFVRSLRDLQLVEQRNGRFCLKKDVQDLAIPSTIYDVIMARVDSLTDSEKEVLQIGSVIEREFSYELIRRVTGLQQQELISRLSALKDSELLFERGVYPNSTFVFKHALTREVVYESILTRKKKQLHGKIGDTIVQLYNDQIDDHYSVLAEHFIHSEDFEKGAEYSILAAKKTQKKASFDEAIDHALKSAACLEKLPQSENIEEKLIDARVTLGLYYNQMISPVEAKEAVVPIVELAEKRGSPKRISQLATIEGTYTYMIEGDYPKAFEYLKEALRIAEEIGDNVSLWVASHWIGHAYAENCEFENALHHLQTALDINVAANITWGISIMKSCIANTVYNTQGRADLGYELSMEGMRLAEESGDTMSKAEAYTFHGCACYLKGFLEDAEKHLIDGMACWERINYLAIGVSGVFCLGEISSDHRDYEKAKDYYKRALSLLAHRTMWPSLVNIINVALTKAYVLSGNNNIDLKQLYANAAAIKIKSSQGMIARFISEILVNMGGKYLSDAEDWIKKAIDADRRNNMEWWHLARDYVLYANLLKHREDFSGAKEKMGAAIKIFEKCGADGWVERYEKERRSMKT